MMQQYCANLRNSSPSWVFCPNIKSWICWSHGHSTKGIQTYMMSIECISNRCMRKRLNLLEIKTKSNVVFWIFTAKFREIIGYFFVHTVLHSFSFLVHWFILTAPSTSYTWSTHRKQMKIFLNIFTLGALCTLYILCNFVIKRFADRNILLCDFLFSPFFFSWNTTRFQNFC